MVGSTNHLDRLDPGISKRPSRFDRKYLFPNPNFEERTLYAQFWRNKLLRGEKSGVDSNEEELLSNLGDQLEFPVKMCKAVANITDGFSFAYIQEAFVAALLAIAVEESDKMDEVTRSFEFVNIDETGVEEAGGDWDCKNDDKDDDKDDEFDKLLLWRELKKQVKILREEIGGPKDS